MQISIDNVMPDDVSKKSLKVLDAKLRMLAEHADFHVNINSVVGGGTANPEDALTISKARPGPRLQLHHRHHPRRHRDNSNPSATSERTVWDEVRRLTRRSYSRFNGFQEAIANGTAQRLALPRRFPLPLRRRERHRQLLLPAARLPRHPGRRAYTKADVKREFLTEKSCAPNCTISCVHQVSYIDHWRAPQHTTITPGGAGHGTEAGLVQIQ